MILRKYNASATINFELFKVDGIDFEPAATFASGDVKIMKDEGAEANTTNLPTDEGQGYSLVLTATEMSAARIVIYIVDQTATKVWLDRTLIIETYGDASAQHAFDLDTALTNALPQKNVATNKIDFTMVLSADNVSPATGKTVTVTKRLDSATVFSSTTGSAPTETGSGAYVWTPSAADSNADVAIYKMSCTGCADTFVTARYRA